ncbi:hypothetical protein Dsui_2507 [Azospira oryzae PS]|uniref:Uncharacterized protein n=1 Tax=Azospira oryzae (strain ATCC BAA-33 / DSM 13638 / PS) TaxID=640081 RepID=G8QN20_AZOOP|nr:hypothetical protein Dsui_2507 [Azospira oryzae PS]
MQAHSLHAINFGNCNSVLLLNHLSAIDGIKFVSITNNRYPRNGRSCDHIVSLFVDVADYPHHGPKAFSSCMQDHIAQFNKYFIHYPSH